MNINFDQWFKQEQNIDKNLKSEPWKEFKVHLFTDEIKRLASEDGKKILVGWEEEVRWEENGSVFEVNVNPFGSLRITARRETKDLMGNNIRVCKYVLPINDLKINRESWLATSIYNRIKKISKKNIDYPVKEYNIKHLAYKLYEKLINNHPSYIMFPTKMLEMNKDYYKIVFEFKGQGVGVPGSNIGLQFNVDLLFDKEIGFIKCWGYDISSPVSSRKYIIQPSEWNEYFSCKQSIEKVTNMISTTLSTY